MINIMIIVILMSVIVWLSVEVTRLKRLKIDKEEDLEDKLRFLYDEWDTVKLSDSFPYSKNLTLLNLSNIIKRVRKGLEIKKDLDELIAEIDKNISYLRETKKDV